MTFSYRPTGVCSTMIDLELEDGIIQSVRFTGGCNGNLKGPLGGQEEPVGRVPPPNC